MKYARYKFVYKESLTIRNFKLVPDYNCIAWKYLLYLHR